MRLIPDSTKQANRYATFVSNLLQLLLVSVALLEFYQPNADQFAEAGHKKSKKYVVVKEMGTTYKKVPIYKKVPVKVLKVVIKKKKPEKPWKKWFKKEMIVKIPKKHHGHHHHAASEGHQTWALPAFIATPSSMNEILEAWPSDYTSTANRNYQQQQQVAASSLASERSSPIQQATLDLATSGGQPQQVASMPVTNGLSSSLAGQYQQPNYHFRADLKPVSSEEYPSFLNAAAELVQSHLANRLQFAADLAQLQNAVGAQAGATGSALANLTAPVA